MIIRRKPPTHSMQKTTAIGLTHRGHRLALAPPATNEAFDRNDRTGRHSLYLISSSVLPPYRAAPGCRLKATYLSTRGWRKATTLPGTNGHRPLLGVPVLEPDNAREDVDFSGRLHNFVLAKPTLKALADGPLRHTELVVHLTNAGGKAIHTRTLDNALTYLTDNRLVVRRDANRRTVIYQITSFGQTVLDSLHVTDNVFLQHLGLDSGDARRDDEDGEPGATDLSPS